MAKVKMVAETLGEYVKQEPLNEEQLNESVKKNLQRFIENPEKKSSLTAAFGRQLGRTKGLKDVLLKFSDENQVKLAKQALKAIEEDPKKGYAWLQIKDGKIVGAGAVGVKAGGAAAKMLGQ